ncbi:hypothetical protein, partial [Bartonella sp. CL71SXKL]|uniref:hypothetical protein n=1 Tax=Bartonella sp. CL71SXKL TaxID=3243540 RepID=UPI0035CECF84
MALPAGVDLSNYYTKGEVDDKLSAVTTGGTVDLTGYLKVADAEETFAKKADLPTVSLDVDNRIVTINGQHITVPNSIDLSDYAKTDDLPKVALDTDQRQLTVDGKSIDIPSNVDLSGFYTKSEVDEKLANVAAGGKIDLTGYLTKSEADEAYAKKDEIPS